MNNKHLSKLAYACMQWKRYLKIQDGFPVFQGLWCRRKTKICSVQLEGGTKIRNEQGEVASGLSSPLFSCSPRWVWTHYLNSLSSLLPLLPWCWDYRCIQLHLVYVIWGIAQGFAYTGKHSTYWVPSPDLKWVCFILSLGITLDNHCPSK